MYVYKLMRTFKTFLLLSVFFLLVEGIKAQQFPQSSHYLFHQLWINPAYAGSSNALQLDLSARGQWLQLEGAPVTQMLSLQMPVPVFSAGLGINLVNDQLGAERNTGIRFSFSKRLIQKNIELSVGLAAGIVQKYLDGSKLITPSGDYLDGINHNDPILSDNGVSSFSPDAALGLYLKTKKIVGGLAFQNILARPFVFSDASNDLTIEMQSHLLSYGSYVFDINRSFSLRPHLLVKTNLRAMQAEAGLMAIYQNRWIASLGFRGYNKSTADSFIGILAYRPARNWTVVYSYDHTISSLGRNDIGSHEISVSYRWDQIIKTKNSKTTYNPRFL